jgi:hypothetical protein
MEKPRGGMLIYVHDLLGVADATLKELFLTPRTSTQLCHLSMKRFAQRPAFEAGRTSGLKRDIDA